ncbi:NADH:flavin oxidoreductase/NADH oxidase [Paenibacillus sp. FSL H7-0350]|uniref:NADH:flavin oxidoreductase/NADH oxidase n=1 Tax=Paenibacillus sp. FSL H7-0350 TaxID=2975345 RepID=UPI00315847F4
MTKDLFTPYEYKSLKLKNRVVMPPMCQYSVTNKDGIANDWHYNHYVSRAVGGTGLIIVEMADVDPDGRITDYDLGLWSDKQIPSLARIVEASHAHGSKIGIQVAHAGRKAEDAKVPVSSSAIPFDGKSKTPHALTTEEVKDMVQKFKRGVERAVQAGFDTIELHGAHGYLIHQFHSPLTNQRTDEYGQDLTLFGREVIAAAKSVMPEDMPLIMRISAREYVEGGYGLQEGLEISRAYMEAGADIFHISSGGEGAVDAENGPGNHAAYQLPLARTIRQELNVPVIAVGRLDEAVLANAVIGNEEADLVAVGRGMLRNPYWTLEASVALRKDADIPKQYALGFPR